MSAPITYPQADSFNTTATGFQVGRREYDEPFPPPRSAKTIISLDTVHIVIVDFPLQLHTFDKLY